MTPEEIDHSRIRVAGPPAGYDQHQGDRSNFDWMTYQLKELEKILGKDDTAAWLNRRHSQLHDTSPAEAVLMDEDSDHCCQVVAQLIVDLITDAPARFNRYTLPARIKKYIAEIQRTELPIRLATIKAVSSLFGKAFESTTEPAGGIDVIMECVSTMIAGIQDPAWVKMMTVIHELGEQLPDSKVVQNTMMLMDVLHIHRKFLNSITKDQPDGVKYIW
jgi:hypothetical protein